MACSVRVGTEYPAHVQWEETQRRYEAEEQLSILEEVGRGGFGRVYRGHHLRLDAPVAVKVLREDLLHVPMVADLFAREARIMARIDHPNVLRVFDYRDGPEGPYLVTEWMSGGSVAPPVEDEQELRAIGSAVASGLQALHEAAARERARAIRGHLEPAAARPTQRIPT
jgi:eukaryotic-like serine/threonine-protein kinase